MISIRILRMAINIEVEKAGTESGLNLLRRFSKKVLGANIIKKVKGGRYKERDQSKYKTHKRALVRIIKREEMNRLLKLGKVVAKNKRR